MQKSVIGLVRQVTTYFQPLLGAIGRLANYQLVASNKLMAGYNLPEARIYTHST